MSERTVKVESLAVFNKCLAKLLKARGQVLGNGINTDGCPLAEVDVVGRMAPLSF